MQNTKIGYFIMGLGVAYMFQSLFKRTSDAPGNSQVSNAQGSNVIDLVAWRRDMPNWR